MIDVVLNDNESDPYVFSIVRRTKAAEFRKSQKDVDTFTSQCDQNLLPKELVVLTESQELATDAKLLTPEICETLRESLRYFECLKNSDNYKPVGQLAALQSPPPPYTHTYI